METIKFNVHYYLSDNSHSMEAYARNRLEKYLLNAISEIAKENNIKVAIRSTAKEQGGIIDHFTIDPIVIDNIKQATVFTVAGAVVAGSEGRYLIRKFIDLLFYKFTKKGKLEIEGIE